MTNFATSKLKIHFPGYMPGKRLMPIAQVCGIGDNRNLSVSKYLNAYDDLKHRGPELWEAAEIESADVVVFPHPYYAAPDVADRVAIESRRRGLPCVFFQPGDNAIPANPPFGLVFRTSLFADQRTACEHAMAAHTDDMLAEIDDLPIRERREKPSVGFCGNVGNRWIELAYLLIRKTRNVHGTRLRRRIINRLRQCPHVDSSFLLRDKWWGGALSRRHQDLSAQKQLRCEYLDNMLETDYTLCVRGAGNFSLRFYEALSACRIPLLIDTKCVLPFEDDIDWNKHCVIVPESSSDSAGEILAEYHQSLTPEEFKLLQHANRELWRDRLCPLAFYSGAIAMAQRCC